MHQNFIQSLIDFCPRFIKRNIKEVVDTVTSYPREHADDIRAFQSVMGKPMKWEDAVKEWKKMRLSKVLHNIKALGQYEPEEDKFIDESLDKTP